MRKPKTPGIWTGIYWDFANSDAVWKDSGAGTLMKDKTRLIKRSDTRRGLGDWKWLPFVFLLGCTAVLQAQVSFAGTQFGLGSGTWNAPASVAVDGRGNLYIADGGNNQVVEMSPGAGGLNAPVTILSGLSSPGAVAADWNGNVFVSDTGNGRILMLPVIAAGFGAPVTLADGLSSPNGLTVDSLDDVFVAQSGSNNVIEILNNHGVYQAPVVVGSGFNYPMGVALDGSRNLFVADTGNGRVLKEPRSSTGYSSQQVLWSALNAPVSLAVDKGNDLFIALKGSKRVQEMVWQAGANRFGAIATIGSGMVSPSGVAVNGSGQVFIADTGNAEVLEVETASTVFGSVAVGSPGTTLTYNFNMGAGASLGGFGVETQGISGKDFTDGGASTCVAQTYVAATVCGVNVSFSPLAPGIRMGAVVLWGTSGNVLSTAFISGTGLLPKAGFLPGTVTQLGAQLSGPTGVAVDGGGNVYIADTGNNRVVELPWTGTGYGQQMVVPVNGLMSPMGLAVDGAGNLYIVSNGNDKVIYLPAAPVGFGPQSKVGSGLYGPSDVAVGADGTVYITDTLDQRVDSISWTGSGFAQEARVGSYHRAPIGLAVDRSGTIYYTDPYQNTVSRLPWNSTRFGDQVDVPVAGISFPTAVAVDANADLFVLDGQNGNLIMLPWNGSSYGQQLVVAGGFNSPSGMAIDSNGVIYVADTGNNQIVRIDMSAPGPLSYASTYLGSTSVDSPRDAMVGNLGNLPVAISAISYPADFPEAATGTNGCSGGATLSASQWCELAINFTPTVASSLLNEAVTVTDNSSGIDGTAQQIPVSGASQPKSTQSINFAAPAGVIYGAAPIALSATATSGLPVSFSVISGPGVLTSNGLLLRFAGAGTVVVQAVQVGNGAFMAAASITVSVSVAPATLTVTPANTSATYGAIPSSFRYAITGFVGGDNTFAVSGQPTIVFNGSKTAGAGNYPLQASVGSLFAANYVFVFQPGVLTVNPAVLQVRASTCSVVYGKSVPALQWSLSGFVNGDSAATVYGAPQLTTAANSGSVVGHYPIVVSTGTLTSANYTFSFTAGTLVVVPATLTVTATSQTVTYGSTLPVLSYSISGFVSGDAAPSAVQGHAMVTTQAVAGGAAGRYVITASAGSLSASNYSFTFISGVLAVQKAVIQVDPQNASMTYGAKLPALTYTMSGFVNGDSAQSAVSGSPGLITSATSHSIPGTFPITCGAGSLSASNYSFVFGSAALTVAKALLTVMPMPVSITYGERVPALTMGYKGFVNGDGPSSLTGIPSSTPQNAAILAAGTYPVVLATGSMTSAKYVINTQNGALTVHPAVLIVAAQNVAMTYGGKVPALAFVLRGFVNGDSAAQVSGAPGLVCAVSAASAVGVYPITATAGSLKAANYTFSFVSGQVAVTKAVLTVVPGNISATYGSELPAMTYSLTGLLNGDTAGASVAGTPQFVTSATSVSPAGSYPVSVGLGSLTAKNYTFAFKVGTIAIGRAQLTVTASNATMTAGGTVPALSYTVKGFANGDTQASAVSGKPSVTTTATSASKAGTYAIVAAQGSLGARNYEFNLVNGTMTVSQ